MSYPVAMSVSRRFKQVAVKIAAVFLLACVSAHHAQAGLQKLNTDSAFNSVYLLEKPASPTITIALTILSGEVDVEGPQGLSHYLEHLMFWHADNVGGKQIHARGGNAWVNGIVTSYYNEGETTELDDMLQFVHRLFSPPDLSNDFVLRERSVVSREYDLRVSEQPDWRIYTTNRQNLYNNLAVSRSVIGTPETIGSLTLKQANAFHQRYYKPGNAVLFIAGNLNKAKAQALVDKKFADLTPGNPLNAHWRDAIITEHLDTTTVYPDEQVSYPRLAYQTMSEWPDDANPVQNWYTLQLLQATLDSALEGGIARPLRMDEFILRSFEVSLSSTLANYFEFTLLAEPDKGVSLKQASTAIGSTLQSIAKTGIPAESLERVRTRMLQTETRNDSKLFNTYFRMSQQLTAGLQPATSAEHFNLIKSVNLEAINKLLQALAFPQRRSVAFIQPAEK